MSMTDPLACAEGDPRVSTINIKIFDGEPPGVVGAVDPRAPNINAKKH
jgi:hypothetical protein